jgi:hypothetical protein
MFGNDGKYQAPLARVRFSATVGEDEIDMDSGFQIMPQAVPVALTPTPGAAGAFPSPAVAAGQKSVEINFQPTEINCSQLERHREPRRFSRQGKRFSSCRLPRGSTRTNSRMVSSSHCVSLT